MRDARGRFLAGAAVVVRHFLTRLDRQKGYLVATQLGAMPSRVRAWLRNKLRRSHAEKLRKKKGK